jgi:chromosome segregation ATPase
VEDTLNNSNDLFLTFRKEMEEMSKKTKRLEKENLTLTRKHDLTNRNILEMAEERTKSNQEIEALKRKNDTLNNIIKQMQQQGRGVPEGMAGMVEGNSEDEEGEGDTESEYDYDDEEGEEGGEHMNDEGEYDTEEDLHPEVFGPAPPPPAPTTNGLAATNGIKH